MNKDLLSNIASNTLTALGGLSGDADKAIISAVFSPMVVEITGDVASRALSALQSSRLGDAINLIFNKFKIRRCQGENFRKDAFMTDNGGEQAKQVLEGILLNINEEYEKKKVEYHANLFTNLCFEERLIFDQALYVTHLIKRLSYRQLILIAIFNRSPIKVENWVFQFEEYSENYIFKSCADLYCEIKDLEQKVIIEDCNPIATYEGSPIYAFKLSVLGMIIYNELDLSSIPEDDINKVSEMLINKRCKIL
ncbi:hypothetical protein EEK90_13010 [Muribaculaceae bacterium Isolate-036 (Harlan)]|nr:hypothetical protein EEK90_13010 [Muribaculaceae bacterium Isolate-036 (Harlan)]